MTLLAFVLFVQMVWKLKTALILLCCCFPMSLIVYFCKEKCLPYFLHQPSRSVHLFLVYKLKEMD